MYESITYEELKSLPRDQKVEALKELKALYPTQKKIAEKLGVNPANIYNMIAKYVKADDEEQPKAEMKSVRKAAKRTGAISEAIAKQAGAISEAVPSQLQSRIEAEAPQSRIKAEALQRKIKAEAPQRKIEAVAPQSRIEAEVEANTEVQAAREAAKLTEAIAESQAAREAAKPTEAITESKAAAFGQEKARVKRMREKKMKREENLLITLSKSLTGEEAQALFAGIGSIFLRNHDYKLEIRIGER